MQSSASGGCPECVYLGWVHDGRQRLDAFWCNYMRVVVVGGPSVCPTRLSCNRPHEVTAFCWAVARGLVDDATAKAVLGSLSAEDLPCSPTPSATARTAAASK